MAVSHYKDLIVWQRSIELVERIYAATADFGPDERFGLVSQLRRAAVSVPSNIAEGNARRSTKDYARFVAMALGSVAEIETQIEIAKRLNLLAFNEAQDVLGECEEISKMLIALERKLKAYAASKISEGSEDWSFDSLVPGP